MSNSEIAYTIITTITHWSGAMFTAEANNRFPKDIEEANTMFKEACAEGLKPYADDKDIMAVDIRLQKVVLDMTEPHVPVVDSEQTIASFHEDREAYSIRMGYRPMLIKKMSEATGNIVKNFDVLYHLIAKIDRFSIDSKEMAELVGKIQKVSANISIACADYNTTKI